MKLEHAIGRMLMLGFRGASLDDPETRADVEDLKKIHAGGVVLFDKDLQSNGARNIESAEQLRKLSDDLRHELGEHLIISVDEEGGEVSRLGALLERSISARDLADLSTDEIRGILIEVAQQLSAFGITLNFAPCVDLAINSDSSIIARRGRSFGTDPSRVADCAHAIIDAHKEHGVRCCLKHFPGHGSALGDTHDRLVDITHTHHADEIEPYVELLKKFNDSICVMTAHLMHRDRDPVYPASLSHAITTRWLREELGFSGVVVTDSLDMGGAALDGAALLAANAGADILLYGNNTPSGFIQGMATQMHSELLEAIDPERAFEAASRIDRAFR